MRRVEGEITHVEYIHLVSVSFLSLVRLSCSDEYDIYSKIKQDYSSKQAGGSSDGRSNFLAREARRRVCGGRR